MERGMRERTEAASRIKAWTRGRFGDVICDGARKRYARLPAAAHRGRVLSPERKHYHFKVFKPLEQVTEDDMPPAWYKDALAVTPGVDCGCC